MTVGEIGHRMSAHELSVLWPEFFAYRRREQARQQQAEENARSQRRFLA